jgi:electron transfer flavoprotein beta subunit
MKIIVCLKQVPDTAEVRINQETGTLIRDGVPSIINPDDKSALEEALRLKDELGAYVTILTMGPAQAKNAINEGLAMGADEGILISDRAFAGSDTWATATILTAAIEKIGDYSIIFCGRQAIDGDTAQVGPEITEFLNLPQITYVKNIEVKDKNILATRYSEDGDYLYETAMPVVFTAIKELNVPRYPRVKGIIEAFSEDQIKVWSVEDLDVDRTQIGLKGSPTKVFKTYVPVKSKKTEMIEGNTAQEKAKNLLNNLKALKIV